MLYIAFPRDLRDLYKDSEWLVYSKMVAETQFTPDDILVLSEWTVSERMELVQTMYRVRQQGARVIYIGPKQSETDDFRRQMCLMGIFDFIFFGDEIVLGEIDELIESPRSPVQVKEYLDVDSQSADSLVELPPVVVVFEEQNESDPIAESDDITAKGKFNFGFLRRRDTQERSDIKNQPRKEASVKKFVWPNPEAVQVRILGDAGSGRSFVAWNLAALCGQRELPSAVVEDDVLTLTEWAGVGNGIHVYSDPPKKGYRVIIDTREPLRNEGTDDFYIVVTWPDKIRIERILLKLQEKLIPANKVMWVINGYSPELPLPVDIGSEYVVIPHEPRQVSATRMKRPLVTSDTSFADLLQPITDQISELFILNAKGVRRDVVSSGV